MNALPAIWRPMGKPAELNPQGTEIAGKAGQVIRNVEAKKRVNDVLSHVSRLHPYLSDKRRKRRQGGRDDDLSPLESFVEVALQQGTRSLALHVVGGQQIPVLLPGWFELPDRSHPPVSSNTAHDTKWLPPE